MKLYCSETSPFARKCRMFVHVAGLTNDVEIIQTNFESAELRAINPLGKIPALKTENFNLFDSTLICDFFDHQHTSQGKKSLFGKGADNYFAIQQLQTQSNGIIESCVLTVMERRRETEHSTYWLERWHKAIELGIKSLPTDTLGSEHDIHIGTLTTAAALGYLDFRLPDFAWRDWHSELAQWFTQIEKADWFTLTNPPGANT